MKEAKARRRLVRQTLQKSECNAYIYLKYRFEFGTFGTLVWEEFIKNSVWTKEGAWTWEKSMWNPKNYSVHAWLDILAIAALIVAGFFSAGTGWAAAAYYASMTIYATSTLYNAALYYQEGNNQMAGIHLLFEVLPFVKITKRLSQIPKAIYAGSLRKAFKAIVKVAPGGFKTNKAALKVLKGHPYAADMVKYFARYGDEALMKLKGTLKGGIKTSGITDKVAKEFMEAIAKESPAIGRRLTLQTSKKIIAEQARTFTKRMMQFLRGAGSISGDALILAGLYDADMIWEPFQIYVLSREGKEVTTSGWPGLRDIQDELHEFVLKTLTEQSEILKSWFGDWRPRDVVTTTLDEDGRRYNWANTRAMYILAVSNPMIAESSCDTIPSERHAQLFEKYKYEPETGAWMYPETLSPADKEEYDNYNAKQIAKTGGDYQGVPIDASELMYKPDVNLALKEDFINGWRPEQKCHEKALTSTDKEMEIRNEQLRKTLLEKHGEGSKAELWYKEYLTTGLKAFKERTGEYLMIGGVEFRPEASDAALELLENNFTLKMKECLRNNMTYYENWETIPEGEDVDFGTPEPPCKVKELVQN